MGGIKTGELSDFRPNTDWTGRTGDLYQLLYLLYTQSVVSFSLYIDRNDSEVTSASTSKVN